MLYPNLEGELKKRDISRGRIAKDLCLSVSTVSRKLNEPNRLKFFEAHTIKKLYFPELSFEYLYATNIQ